MKDERKRQEFRNLLNGMHQENMLKEHKESKAREKKEHMAKNMSKGGGKKVYSHGPLTAEMMEKGAKLSPSMRAKLEAHGNYTKNKA